MATRYAKGDRARGICQRCGLWDRLRNLVEDDQYPKLLVHVECWDPRHPQERLKPIVDPVVLYRPSPEEYPIVPPVLAAEFGELPDTIELTWTEATSHVLNINGYRLYRAVNDGEYELVDTFPVLRDDFGAITSQTLEYTDETVFEDGDEIAYFVVAYSGLAENGQDVYEARSNIAALEFEVPENTPAVLTASQSFRGLPPSVSWTAADFQGQPDSYTLFRSINGAAAEQIAVLAGDVLSYTDLGYTYADLTRNVNVVDDTGASGYFGFSDGTGNYNWLTPFGSVDNAALGPFTINSVLQVGNQAILALSGVTTPPALAVKQFTLDGRTFTYQDGNYSVVVANQRDAGYLGVTQDLVGGQQYPITITYATGPRAFVDGDDVAYYVVATKDATSNQSNTDEITYQDSLAPVLSADQDGGSPPHLTWTPAQAGTEIMYYDIYRRVNGGDYEYLDSADGTATSYFDISDYDEGDELDYYIIGFPAEVYVDAQQSNVASLVFVPPTYLGLVSFWDSAGNKAFLPYTPLLANQDEIEFDFDPDDSSPPVEQMARFDQFCYYRMGTFSEEFGDHRGVMAARFDGTDAFFTEAAGQPITNTGSLNASEFGVTLQDGSTLDSDNFCWTTVDGGDVFANHTTVASLAAFPVGSRGVRPVLVSATHAVAAVTGVFGDNFGLIRVNLADGTFATKMNRAAPSGLPFYGITVHGSTVLVGPVPGAVDSTKRTLLWSTDSGVTFNESAEFVASSDALAALAIIDGQLKAVLISRNPGDTETTVRTWDGSGVVSSPVTFGDQRYNRLRGFCPTEGIALFGSDSGWYYSSDLENIQQMIGTPGYEAEVAHPGV